MHNFLFLPMIIIFLSCNMDNFNNKTDQKPGKTGKRANGQTIGKHGVLISNIDLVYHFYICIYLIRTVRSLTTGSKIIIT